MIIMLSTFETPKVDFDPWASAVVQILHVIFVHESDTTENIFEFHR